jgi:hypothetical protein
MKNSDEKFDRRRALECNLLRESKCQPGYWVYEVLVGEVDGTTHLEEVDGKDMSDALNRLLWSERSRSIEKFVTRKSVNVMVFLWVMGVILPAIVSTYTNSPIPIVSVLVFNLVCFLVWKFWNNWIAK